MKYSWPLNVPQFSFKDILKISGFFLKPNNRWTQDIQVRHFEEEMAQFVGVNRAVFVSSGSTANTILAMYLKDNIKKKKIIFPSTTWITSVSPFIREGFEPLFVDINLEDFSMDLDAVEAILKSQVDEIGCIFITSLLGFVPDIDRLQRLSNQYGVLVMMDNCENTLGQFNSRNVSSFFTSTTSTYFGHQIQSVEGGFLFTNSEREYQYFLMARNHGMVRSLPQDKQSIYANPSVNPRFDFNILGNNFRNTDINAFIGRLDLKRAGQYRQKRMELFSRFRYKLESDNFLLPKEFSNRGHVPFALPVIFKNPHPRVKDIIKSCEDKGIETRPIISGNLLRQTCLAKYRNQIYRNSELLHNNGFYVGLHNKTTKKQISKFTLSMNLLALI